MNAAILARAKAALFLWIIVATVDPPPAIADSQTVAGSAAAVRLQMWDKKQIEVRENIWRSYSAKVSFGMDSRGRSIADDLNDWVMTTKAQQRLASMRSNAEALVKTNDDAQALKVLDSGESEIRAQLQLLANVDFYWKSLLGVRRQHDLWIHWIAHSPVADAAQSRTLIAPAEANLSRDFPRTASHAEIERWAASLSYTYDAERRKLAAIASESSLAAGKEMASRQGLTNCDKSRMPHIEQKHPQQATNVDQPVKVATDMSPDRFYPTDARRDRISGSIELRIAVSATGCAERVDVLRSTGADELDQAAMDWAEYVQFLPAMHANKSVVGTYSRTIAFRADDASAVVSESAQSPATPAAYVARGSHSLDQGQYDKAIDDFNKAIDLDPMSALAFADRAMAYIWQRKFDTALRDLDAASRIEPRNQVVFRGRGLLALEAGDLSAAITAFSTSLDIQPRNEFTLSRRAATYLRLGEKDRALADYAESLAASPKSFELHSVRALIFRSQGKPDQSLAEASSLIENNPDDAGAYRVAAAIYASSGADNEAMRCFDRAVQLSSSGQNLLARALYRHGKDPIGEREDLKAVLGAKPDFLRASILLANSQLDSGDASAALDTLQSAINRAPENAELLAARGIIYMKSGQTNLADADFIKAREHSKDPRSLNGICWAKATANVSLDSALEDCNAALEMSPNAGNDHDSHGFVMLRLGRYDAAIKSYDAALRLNPILAASLYGRGLAKQSLGKASEANADILSALMCDAQIAARFAGYGIAKIHVGHTAGD